jgi:hypothetical protein
MIGKVTTTSPLPWWFQYDKPGVPGGHIYDITNIDEEH